MRGYNVDSGSRRLAGRYDNPMPESTISIHSGTKNLATDSSCWLTNVCTVHNWDLGITYRIHLAVIREMAYWVME